ncbi:tyrosine-type recombinase/integrase [Pseudodesulfovibrio cashew]|uniref:Tyrosine-type recombinase/integrase n=1 Tax=Pseudodesulfovibrio cashew TaxID=2678688 RepID=A0A6I6JKU1_9BACT|nr:tyrosine-type recombinase/integrase [Pseudodesulfovibrio cashew]QGY40912.1 tyrosine-type recombinase/integrase [Pseudodesulfovibrio cashew]
MPTKLTQGIVNKARGTYPAGKQLYDSEVSGLRLVIGKKSASFKLVTDQWVNGRKVRAISVTLGRSDELSLKEARHRAIENKLAVRRGENPNLKPVARMTLKDSWEDYRQSRGKELSPETLTWYERKLLGPLKALMNRPLSEIGRSEVRTLHQKMTETTGPYGANGAMRVLKLLYNHASAVEDLPPNPVSRAVRMNKEKARDWALSHDEIRDLWERIENNDDRIRAECWALMLSTGLRSMSARSARWEHLSEEGVLHVPTPKGGADRAYDLPIPKGMYERLMSLKSLCAPLASPFIFPSPNSKHGFVNIRREESMPYSPHQARHTFRNLAVEAGVDFTTTALVMNHKVPHVSFSYISRSHLMGELLHAVEAVWEKINDISS